eukprot:NODE_191_length_1235_cov_389.385379_g187_i0.p1 GENE.NODE_191_length_1235_cov_389.385379_g187_i0~~NODE_191_length_1235_cov_389.385379_g187_i0.p1  ORF type:complete len:322 (-),score=72.35 NODE_191_length_1235_cov_389.385379_g187_i0:191-1156(-)
MRVSKPFWGVLGGVVVLTLISFILNIVVLVQVGNAKTSIQQLIHDPMGIMSLVIGTPVPDVMSAILHQDVGRVTDKYDDWAEQVLKKGGPLSKAIQNQNGFTDMLDSEFTALSFSQEFADKCEDVKTYSGNRKGTGIPNLVNNLLQWMSDSVDKHEWKDIAKDCDEFLGNLQKIDWSGTYPVPPGSSYTSGTCEWNFFEDSKCTVPLVGPGMPSFKCEGQTEPSYANCATHTTATGSLPWDQDANNCFLPDNLRWVRIGSSPCSWYSQTDTNYCRFRHANGRDYHYIITCDGTSQSERTWDWNEEIKQVLPAIRNICAAFE